jgi:hypothetical protein
MADTHSRLTELPVEPHTALAVHFGMLLGVSDIELLAANPRGKLRLHNAWLHGAGVVWGFRVAFDSGSRELAVDPGLALDAHGRELSLGRRVCLNIDDWYAKHGNGEADLTLDVNVRWRACLDRPVPALAGECDDSPETAYSRIQETVQIDLEPPVERPPTTFLRVRAGTDPDVARAAALDSLELALPEGDVPVVVARITVAAVDGHRPEVTAVEYRVRRVHLPTTLVTELLAPHAPVGAHLRATDAEWLDDQHVAIPADTPLHPATLAGNVTAHRWDPAAGNWAALNAAPAFANDRLEIDLGEAMPAGTTVRIVVTGSGPTPVAADVGGKPVPLAGDVTLTIERS